ncbi:MAG: hypothetical protein J7M19_08675 [Planctomycetes bacterium]|nr:hypothetical protein [Planctomycetota bacterium]
MRHYAFFLAGIIQGSITQRSTHSQDYRRLIREIIEKHVEGARVYCPFENHPNSLEYDDSKASQVFFDHIQMAARTDCLVAYLPEASMGTAVEMFAAHNAGRAIVSVSPLGGNWTVRFLSDRVLGDLGAFGEFAASGHLVEFLDEYYAGEDEESLTQ